MISNDRDRLFLKVERGKRPFIEVFDEQRRVKISVPNDLQSKWPPLSAQISGGLTITIRRLEQQYKITVQHILERKPDVTIYVNITGCGKDLKTSIRDVNTRLDHIGIAGPYLEISGRVKALKVTFESTIGALYTNAKLQARSVALSAQNIVLQSETVFFCTSIRLISRRVQIDGRISTFEEESKNLSIDIDASLLHLGVDGMIGSLRCKENVTNRSLNRQVEKLSFRLSGNLVNFGRITAESEIKMCIGGSVLSLKDIRIDSAGRGYAALKQIRGVTVGASSPLPTSSSLNSAIVREDPNSVAQLLEHGVDLNDSCGDERKISTPKRTANIKYEEMRTSGIKNKMREKITLIQALISTHGWRRGIIKSELIVAQIDRDCADCAQFCASNLLLTTLGDARCEKDSIWSSNSVVLLTKGNIIIEGQVKHCNIDVNCKETLTTTGDGIVSQKQWANIRCAIFSCAGIWSVNAELRLEAQSAVFLENSFVESGHLDCAAEESCQISGTWQTRSLNVYLGENLVMLHNGKILVDEFAEINATTFSCRGIWKVDKQSIIRLKESLSIYPTGQLSVNNLMLIVEGSWFISGHIAVETIAAFVRKDVKTSKGGLVNIQNEGAIIAGVFRNTIRWQSESSLVLKLACCEQSEDGIIFAKDKLTLTILDDSLEDCGGRFFANRCIINVMKKFRVDAYVRVNHIELCTPFVNESCFILGGQLEVLCGPVVLEGRSERSNLSEYGPHTFPAFIVEGQLKAEAIIAPLLSLRFSSASYVLLSGINSISASKYRVIICAGYLHSMRSSFIDSFSGDTYPEAIICKNTWFHEGHVRFRGDVAYLISDAMVNWGRLTNESKLQNHMRSVHVYVESLFMNESVFSANTVCITGHGQFVNRNRIFAADSMSIILPCYKNESFALLLDNSKLFLCNDSRDKMKTGQNEEKENSFGITQSKRSMSIKKFGLSTRNSENVPSELVVNKMPCVNQEHLSILAARETIIFDSTMDLKDLELTLGPSYETEVIINSNQSLHLDNLRICGISKYLTIKVSGELTCESISLDHSIKNVRILGTGCMTCHKSLNVNGETIAFLINSLRVSEVLCNCVKFIPKNSLKILSPSDTTTKFSVRADECYFSGNVLVQLRMELKCNKGNVNIEGELIGVETKRCELSIECDSLMFDGHISNFDFIEIYANGRLDYCSAATIRATRSIAMEAEYVSFHGTSTHCKSITVTAQELEIKATLSGHDLSSEYLFYATIINYDGCANRISKLELSGADIRIAGVIRGVETISFDARTVRLNSEIVDCKNLTINSCSIEMNGSTEVDNLNCTVVESIIIDGQLAVASHFQLCSFLAVFCGKMISLPSFSHINTIIWVSDQRYSSLLSSGNSGQFFLNICGDQSAEDASKPEKTELITHLVQVLNDISQFIVASDDSIATSQSFINKYRNLKSVSLFLSPDYFGLLHEQALIQTRASRSFQCMPVISIRNFLKFLSKLPTNLLRPPTTTSSEASNCLIVDAIAGIGEKLIGCAKALEVKTPKVSEYDCGYNSGSSSEAADGDTELQSLSPDSPISDEVLSSNHSKRLGEFMGIDKSVDEDREKLLTHKSTWIYNDETSSGSSDSRYKDRFVQNGERHIPVGPVDFIRDNHARSFRYYQSQSSSVRPSLISDDLAMKRLQIKEALISFNLEAFGSSSSLASFDTIDERIPKRAVPSPMRQSQIPRFSPSRRVFVVKESI